MVWTPKTNSGCSILDTNTSLRSGENRNCKYTMAYRKNGMQSITQIIQYVATVSLFALLFTTASVRAGEMNWGSYAHAHTRVCEFADCSGVVLTNSDTVEGAFDDDAQEQSAFSSASSGPHGTISAGTDYNNLSLDVYSIFLRSGSTSSVAGGAVEGVAEGLAYYIYSGSPKLLTITTTLAGEFSGPLSGADNNFDGIRGTVRVFQNQEAIDAISLDEVGAVLECVLGCYFPDQEMSVQLDENVSVLSDSATFNLNDGDGFYVHGRGAFVAAGGGTISNTTRIGVSFSSIEGLISVPGPVQIDADGDEVPDSLDNCTNSPNPGQIDVDGDGFGNRCDPDHDNNCVVNFLDIIRYSQSFNSAIGDSNYDPLVDLDSSGAVGFVDYAITTGTYLRPPGPSNVECVAAASEFK